MRFLLFICLLLSNPAFAAVNQTDSLIASSKILIEQGHYYLALDNLETAATQTNTAQQQTQITGLQGLTHYRMHHYRQASYLLSTANKTTLGNQAERVQWLAVLAEINALQGKTDKARTLYAEAIDTAAQNKKLLIGIRLSQLRIVPIEQRLTELLAIEQTLNTLQPGQEQLPFFLNLAIQASALGLPAQKLAYQNFNHVKAYAEPNSRLLATALNGLAQLYEQQNRYPEALQLNSEGIAIAQNLQAHDLLMELYWREGRLYQHTAQSSAALIAYQHAIEAVEVIRQDIPIEYHDGRSSFRETLEPLYLGLADLLLQQAKQQNDEEKNLTLHRARETVELLKQSEVEDFLGGRCAVDSNKAALLEKIEPHTAILYPILLPDRLELLVSTADQIQQFSQPIAASLIQSTARQMATRLRNGDNAKSLAQQLYSWLIAPTDAWLQQQQIQTLVIVSDGALRLIPLAALYDGKQYLIEHYAIATSPGLTLMASQPLQQRGLKTLLAGMSEPGNVIEHLPDVFLNDVAAAARGVVAKKSTLSPDSDSADNTELATNTRTVEVENLLRQPVFRQQVKEKLSLPGVADEINGLRKEISNNTLIMNESFTVAGFKQQLSEQPYSIVHIASHGVFGSTAATSFIMAYDDVINLNQLESLFRSEKFKRQPIELLTLSACETAEGDDRAPLGLAGMAIRAKVRAALGALWSVSDEATFKLITEFYRQLQQPGVSKAEALRQAQLVLLKQKDKEFDNPFFWAPFILVGNWL